MTNCYWEYIRENEAEIARLEGQIERFTARGVRLNSIPAIEAQIAKLRTQIPTLRGTAKLVDQKYG